MEFANEFFQISKVIKAGESVTFPFGPPTAGTIVVKLERVFEMPFSRRVALLPNLRQGTFSEIVIPSNGKLAAAPKPLRPKPPGVVTGPIIGPGGPVIGPGGGTEPPPPPDVRPGDPNKVNYQLKSGSKVMFEGRGTIQQFDYQPASAPALPSINLPKPWLMQVTNESNRDYSVQYNLWFKGNRKIEKKEVNFALFQQKLDEIFSGSDSFFRIILENKKDKEVQIRQPGQPVRTIKVWQTHFKLEGSPLFDVLYGNKQEPLGRKYMTNKKVESNPIKVMATTFDGRFALRVDLVFHPLKPIKFDDDDLLGIWDAAVDIDVKVHRLYLSIFVVLDETDLDQVSFKTVINRRMSYFDARNKAEVLNKNLPHFSGHDFNTKLIGMIESSADEALDKFAYNWGRENEMSFGRMLQNWLLGDAKFELSGYEQRLWLKYPGEKPSMPVLHPGNGFHTQPTQPPLTPGNLSKIDHIVVMMLENRSFDHMLGYLSLPAGRNGRGRSDVDGLTGNESNLGSRTILGRRSRHRVFPMREGSFRGVFGKKTAFPWDPGHGYSDTARQRGRQRNGRGGMDGFITDFALRLRKKYDENPGNLEHLIMGYYDHRDLYCYDHLAQNYGLCDQWYAAHPGSTWPNRFITVTGYLAPDKNGFPDIHNPDPVFGFDPLEVPTIFDHLTDKDISWAFFEHDLCFLRLFSKYTWDDERVISFGDPVRGFERMAQAGRLPSVTFIEPDLTDIPGANDDHPPSDVLDGQDLVARVYNALKASPQWNKTLFIVTYDEHGGFYDHVYPREDAAPLFLDPDDKTPVTTYGMRVPTLVVSPWVEKASVSKAVYDHTSIIKTIIARFLPEDPPYMGPRVLAANHLGSMLSRRRLDLATTHVGPLVIKARRRSRNGKAPAPELSGQINDFHYFMGQMKKKWHSEKKKVTGR